MADFPLPTAPAISLAGAWQAAETDGPTRAELTLPGDILSGLVEAGIEPDPFFGQNEYAAREVAHKTWRVSRSVEISAADLAAAGNWYLDLSYVDTLTTITVNDQVVCRTDNCFMRYRPDVSDALRPGENLIEIEFAPSPSAANARAANSGSMLS